MSEFLGEASVLVKPDTSKFRGELILEIEKAKKGLIVQIPVAATAGGTAQVQKEVTQATKAANVATKERAAALQLEGAAAARLAAEEQTLAATQRAQAEASAALAVASTAGAGAATELAAAQEVLEASAVAVAKAQTAVDVALQGYSVEAQEAALLTQRLATVQHQEALAAVEAAEANVALGAAQKAAALDAARAGKLSAAAAGEQASKMEALQRGAGATSLSLLGVRGATLAAGSSFLVGAAGVTILAKAIQGAAEDEEALAAATKFLGEELAGRLDRSAQNLATTFGLVDDQVLRFESNMAQIFNAVGVSDQAVAGISERLVKLAADIAAVKDVDVEQVFKALQSALLGNLRGLRQLSIGLSAVEINERALSNTGKELAKDLTDEERIMARLQLIYEKTAGFQGGFADESQRLGAQTKILKSNIDDLSDTLGAVLIPYVEELIKDLNFAFQGFRKLRSGLEQAKQGVEDFIPGGERTVGILKDIVIFTGPGQAVGALHLLRKAFDENTEAAGLTTQQIEAFFGEISASGGFFQNFLDNMSAAEIQANATAGAVAALAASIRLNNAAMAGLQGQLLDIQFAGGSPEAQIANLNKQLAKAEQGVKLAEEQGKGILRAREERNRIQDQIHAIQDEEARKAEQAANEAKSAAAAASRAAEQAAREAEQRRQEHDQNIQDEIERQQQLRQLALTRAESTKWLTDDIREQVKNRNLILKQIKGLAQEILDDKLRKQVLLELRQQLAETRAAIKDLYREQRKMRIEAKKAALERKREAAQRAVDSIQLDIDLAETREQVNRQIRLHNAKIKALKAEQKLYKQGTLEYKRIRNEIAAEKKAIADLLKETKDRGRLAASLQFEFMQQQQGFAATLLGNLIPGMAALGTVGSGQTGLRIPGTGNLPKGAKIPGVPDRNFATPRTRFEHGMGGRDIEAGARGAAGAPRGASQAQTGTMIELLRGILRVLQHQDRRAAVPEANHQKSTGAKANEMM